MIGIPADVTSAAHAAFDHPIRDDGASLNSLVNKDAQEAVIAAIEFAIMQERRKHTSEVNVTVSISPDSEVMRKMRAAVDEAMIEHMERLRLGILERG